MTVSTKKAEFNLSDIGKVSNDLNYLNYKTLAIAIVYGKTPDLSFLTDKTIEKERMAELDAIYAQGDKPDLAKEFPRFSNIIEQTNSKKGKPVKITNLNTGEEFNFKKIKDAAEYLRKEEGNSRSPKAYCELIKRKEIHNNFKIELDRSRYKSVNRGKSTIPVAIGMKNIKTGEELEFISITKCMDYLKDIYGVQTSTRLIKDKIRQGKTYKKEWIFYYLKNQGGD